MILEWTGVEPRSRGQAERQSFQAGYSFLGLHSIDGADRHKVAISEIIQAPRLQPGPASRECGGTRTRPDDQDGFRGVHKKSPALHSGRTRLTFWYRQAPVGSRVLNAFRHHRGGHFEHRGRAGKQLGLADSLTQFS